MKKQIKKAAANGILIALSFMALIGVGYVFAAPTAPPSEGVGVAVPLNIGSEAQTKAGDLTVSGTLTSTTLNVDEICLAGECKTEWPGANVPATISGANYASITTGGSYSYGYYCYNYNFYALLTYYLSGQLKNAYSYNCGSTNFSVTMPSGLPAGSTIISVTNPVIWCHGGVTNYQPSGNPTLYVSDTYYPYRTQASNVDIITSGNNIVVTGNCTFLSNGVYTYMGVRLESADVLYGT